MSGAAPAVVEARRVSLSYIAPPPCPGEAGFLEHVQSRATWLRLEPESLPASLPDRVYVVLEPEPSGSGWQGELRIVGTSALMREVRGARCDDVVAALALITVLRLERSDGSLAGPAGSAPGAAGAGEPTRPAEAGAAAQLSAATDAEKSTSSPEAAVEEPTRETPTPAPVEQPAIPEEPATPDADVEAPTLAAEAAVADGATPAAAPEDLAGALPERTATPARANTDDTDQGADGRADDSASAGPLLLQTSVFGHLGYSSMPSHAFKAALGAELRLGETVASWSGALSLALARGNDLSADGTSELTLLTAELRLCPPGVSLDAGFWFRGCAQLSAGRLALSLSPSRDLATTDVTRPWLALGPSLGAGLPLSPGWTLHGTSALMFHLIRDTFGREPAAGEADPETLVPLYRPEAISIELLLGLGYTF